MLYRHRPTPLHAARASVGFAWCAALMLAVLVAGNPVTLVLIAAAGLFAGRLAGVGARVVLATAFMLPWAIGFLLINVIAARQGLTVIARLGDLGPFGSGDITLEAVVYGLIFGLRLVALVIPSALLALAVDPDDLLRSAGRISPRGALGATIATRMVPALAADAKRLDQARRLRPVPPRGGRVAILRAVTAGALDRALDVAATLELRGFTGGSRRRRERRPWSRQDLAFATSALAVCTAAVTTRLFEAARFDTYPEIEGSLAAGVVPGLVIAALALAPFAVRKGSG